MGPENWQALVETEYLVEPMADQNYVTTGALTASEYKLASDKPEQPVAIVDLEEKVRKWIGGDTWMCAVDVDLRILPDGSTDLVKRLTKVTSSRCRVIPSKQKTIILGKPTLDYLRERKCEEMGCGARTQADDDRVAERLEELLEAVRLEGMSTKGLARARELVTGKARDVWRLKLGAEDVADLPAIPIELKPGAPPLPKLHMRRYSKKELDFWDVVIKEMLEAKIIRPRPPHRTLSPRRWTTRSPRRYSALSLISARGTKREGHLFRVSQFR